MKYNYKYFVFIVGLCFVLTSCLQSNNSNNNQSDNSNTSKSEFKIAASSVTVANILAEMNVDIVGKPTTKKTLPSKYSSVPEIGSSFSPSFEQIISLGANLLIGDDMFKKDIDDKAKQYGIETLYINSSNYTEFIKSISDIGDKLNKKSEANNIINNITKPIEEIREKYKNNTFPTVAIIFGSSESNKLATPLSYIGSLVKETGAINITDKLSKDINSQTIQTHTGSTSSLSYLDLSLEQVLVENPDIILRFSHGNVEETKKAFDKEFETNPVWKNLDAVKNGKVYDLDSNIFDVSANLQVGEAIKEIGKLIYEK